MGRLDEKRLKALMAKPPGRYPDGGGLYFKTTGKGRAYFTYRYTLKGREHEISLGAYPETKLDEARVTHLRRCADVAEGVDPAAAKQTAKAAKSGKAIRIASIGKPTFGEIVETCLEKKDGDLANAKSRQQWAMTLRKYAAPLRDKPVDQIDTAMILDVLRPLWREVPETASRLRGRIEFVLAAAQVAGHIDPNRANPARWKGWLEHNLPKRKKRDRGHHAAMPYKEVPAFMARLAETPHVAARALQFAILTAARSGEVFGMTWAEIDLDHTEIVKGLDGQNLTVAVPLWTIKGERMKAGKAHLVPLSAPALAIIAEMQALRWNDHPFVFAGQRPRRPLSNMAMTMVMRRLGASEFTPHGFRSAFRNWATEVEKVEYATAERCLAHAVGSDAALAYDRSDRLALRQPVMENWSRFVTGATSDNVVPLRAQAAQ